MQCNWDFSGQSGIITGAASGIGAALSQLLSKSGAELTLVDRNSEGLNHTIESCTANSSTKPLAIYADFSNRMKSAR